MNAIELAEVLSTCRHPAYIGLLCREASEVVRRQHEAIVKLREALRMSAAALEVRSAFGDADLANVTLEATNDFVK